MARKVEIHIPPIGDDGKCDPKCPLYHWECNRGEPVIHCLHPTKCPGEGLFELTKIIFKRVSPKKGKKRSG